MDSEEEDRDYGQIPRRPTRWVPQRAAKVKAPTRLTRSTAEHFSSSAQSETDNKVVTPAQGHKRKGEEVLTAASKRPRRMTAPATYNEDSGAESIARSSKSAKAKPAPRKKAKLAKTSNSSKSVERPKSTVLPGQWRSLPYLVWRIVFEQLAAPLHKCSHPRDVLLARDVAEATTSLLAAARAAKFMTGAALTALYQCPPLDTVSIRGLRRSLYANTLLNYRPMVETLRINIVALTCTIGGIKLTLDELIRNLPRLVNIELFHGDDDSPYRHLDTPIPKNSRYPDDLLVGLEPAPHAQASAGDKTGYSQLRGWTWSSRLAGESFPLEKILTIHRSPSFASLRKITFINYQLPSSRSKNRVTESDNAPPELVEADANYVDRFVETISALPELEHLVLESSTVVNDYMLGLLPRNLKRLELINCWEVDSEGFSDFLMSHGSQLEELRLNHCISLDLSYLQHLAKACPSLISLHMNMKYFPSLESSSDSEPFFKVLMRADQVPSWPTTLQVLDIQHQLGKYWSIDAADAFFQSLVDSASTLPHLRQVLLKATLDEPFRVRAEFRDRWVRKLIDVFKRPMEEPQSILARVQQFAVRRAQQAAGPKTPTRVRRSHRLAEQMPGPSDVETPEVRGRQIPPTRTALRESLRLRSSRRDDEADNEYSSEDELALGMKASKQVYHGMCDIVDVHIDNQKPTEQQYSIEHFLDSDDESDDEYLST